MLIFKAFILAILGKINLPSKVIHDSGIFVIVVKMCIIININRFSLPMATCTNKLAISK